MNPRAKAFAYLDILRESGITNMWGAQPYLASANRLSNEDAKKFHLEWMDSFDPEKSPEDRAAAFQ